MRIYQTVEDSSPDAKAHLHRRLTDAQKHLKDAVPAVFRADARIFLLDVPTDLTSLIDLLMHPDQLRNISYRIGAWRMTARGGISKFETI